MILDKIKSNIKFAYPELKALFTRELPDFVFKNNTKIENEIVIFSFHTPIPDIFEKQIRYLVENKYNVITTDEFHRYLFSDKPIPPNCIMLTFDDCRASLWTVVYPILKKYGLTGVAYLSPYFIININEKRPQWNGNASGLQYIEVDRTSYPFASWEEIAEMHESGVIDFQGHTFYHELIFISPEIVDFINPVGVWNFHNFDVPVVSEGVKKRYDRQYPLGTPIYKTDTRMSGKYQYYDDERLREHCVRYVYNNGRERFFDNRNWKKKLISEANKFRKSYGERGCFETEEEMIYYLKTDLLMTRKTIEKRLSGKKVTSMCFPWENGSDIAIKMAKEAGYQSCVWGIIPGKKTNYSAQNPFYICRISSDFIFRLPGKKRSSFFDIILYKFLKRIKRTTDIELQI
ncbi:MAG: polysaccharide deacetylase family protein [Deltaproteobacteria bacterium]|nr:polysaccharide deacetylase family protein [Deltaproteobacteria bacterium]